MGCPFISSVIQVPIEIYSVQGIGAEVRSGEWLVRLNGKMTNGFNEAGAVS